MADWRQHYLWDRNFILKAHYRSRREQHPADYARLLLTFLLPVLSLSPRSGLCDGMEWHRWRGHGQNGISSATNLVDRFDPSGGAGSNLLWKSDRAAGISTPIVMRGKLYTIVRDQPGTPEEGEKVICLDSATGNPLWENRYNIFLSDVPAERIGWSNCAGDPATGDVYVLSSSSQLQRMNGETGKTVWSRSLSEEFGMLSTYGGRTNTPVLFEDLVIVSGVTTGWGDTARPAHRFLAFDQQDGRLVWITGTRPFPEDTTYSTPFITEFAGQAALVAGSGDGGIYAIQPRTGKIIWSYQLSRRGVNVSPLVANDVVFASHSEENPNGTKMGAVVAIRGTQVDDGSAGSELWRLDGLAAGKSSPLFVGGRLYVIDDSAGLHVIDAQSGNRIGKKLKLGTSMRGSPVWANGKIYACTATGIFHVLRPTETGIETVFKTRLLSGEECGGSIAIAQGRIYIPTTGGLYCLGDLSGQVTAAQSDSVKLLPETAATPTPIDNQPALLQIVPAEAIVPAGEVLKFEVRIFNAAGQRLSDELSDASLSANDTGLLDNSGVFRPTPRGQHTSAVITATLGDLSSQARVRIVPELPWKFGFSDEQVPISWIGAQYRHEPRSVNGEPSIVKITTIPKGTRSQLWMGQTSLHDYTVQADLKAAAVESGSKPDMGLIAQRYTLDLMGEASQLQIRTWPPQLRMARSIPFQWESDVWYTAKLRASNVDGKAILQAKVWKRDEPEPEAWTLTAEDAAPNRQGSPGLFGNSTNAEIYIDNVTVTAN